MMIFHEQRLKGVKRRGANTVRIHKTNFQGSEGMVVWWDRLRLGLHRMSWIIFALELRHLSAVTAAAVYFCIIFYPIFILHTSLNVIGSKQHLQPPEVSSVSSA